MWCRIRALRGFFGEMQLYTIYWLMVTAIYSVFTISKMERRAIFSMNSCMWQQSLRENLKRSTVAITIRRSSGRGTWRQVDVRLEPDETYLKVRQATMGAGLCWFWEVLGAFHPKTPQWLDDLEGALRGLLESPARPG